MTEPDGRIAVLPTPSEVFAADQPCPSQGCYRMVGERCFFAIEDREAAGEQDPGLLALHADTAA